MAKSTSSAVDSPLLPETGGICYDGWWDSNLSWDAAVPDFTNCFTSTVFIAVACVCLSMLCFAAACRARSRFRSHFNAKSNEADNMLVLPASGQEISTNSFSSNATRSPWFYAKAGVSAALFTGCVSRLVYLYLGVAGRSTDALALIGDALEIILIVSSGLYTEFSSYGKQSMQLFFSRQTAAVYKTIRDQRQLRRASSTLFITFLLLSLCHGLRCYSLAVRCNSDRNPNFPGDSSSCSVLLIWEAVLLSLSFMLLLLNCFADTYGRRMAFDKKASPLLTISFPSFLTFAWVFKLVYNGWRRPITYDDLWHLPSAFKSVNTEKSFEYCWSNERKRAARRNATPSLARALYNMIACKFWLGVLLQLCNVLASFATPLVLKLLLRVVTEEHDKNLIASEAGGEQSRMPIWKGILFSLLLFAASVGASLFENHFYRLTYSFATTFRSALTLATYRKLYRVSNDARRQWTIGELVNLLSVDSQRVLDFTTYMYCLVLVPVSVTFSIVLLWQELGPSALAGVAVIVFVMPINTVTGALQHRVYFQQLQWKDKRMAYMAEILSGIKVLKLYAWERPFMQRVMRCRTQEVRRLRIQSLLEVVGAVTWELTPIIMAITCFATHVWLTGGDIRLALTAEKMFVSMALFNLLTAPLGLLPMIIMLLVQCRVALDRYAKFLLSDESDADTVKRLPAPPSAGEKSTEPAVIVSNGNFAWTKHRPEMDGSDETDIILHDINLTLPVGSLTAVVGVVGAGKSSLCSAVLGLMDKRQPVDAAGAPFVQVCGRIAYVPQQAWIRNDSLRNNIVFTSKFDPKRYERVIDACALVADFDILPGGDETEIGEKGVNLSGGQKQRVSLARAAYSDADVYILDDPLSAVDAHVAQHLFDRLISNKSGSFLANTTRLLITHSTSVLPHCDMIVVLEDGRIVERGTYAELIQRTGGRLAELVSNLAQQNEAGGRAAIQSATSNSSVLPVAGGFGRSVSTATGGSAANGGPTYGISPRVVRMSSNFGTRDVFDADLPQKSPNSAALTPKSMDFAERSYAVSNHEENSAVLKPLLSIENGEVAKIGRNGLKSNVESMTTSGDVEKSRVAKLIEQEEAQTGNVGASVYLLYARLMSIPLSSICFIAYFVYQAFFVGAEIWLVNWSTNVDRFIAQNNTLLPGSNRPVDFLSWQKQQLAVFAGLGGGMSIFLAVASFLLSICTVRAMYYLHKRMLERIMHAPMSFFDTTPLGRLINRFARDIDSIDTELPARIRPLMQIIVSIIGILGLICYGTPMFSVVIVFLLVLFIFVQRFYICTSRQLKRIETVNRSPIFSHFSETAQGIAVIKAMQLHDLFVKEFERHVDAANVPYFYWFYADRWVFVALCFIGALCVLFASLFAILSPYFGVALTPSILGLVVSNALNLSMPLQWFVRILSETETYIVSVERIKEYMENVPQEASWDTLALTPATTTNFSENSVLRSHWPEQGCVEFDDYATRYRAGLDLVLNGIEADVRSCEKIGIAGRTGAGKSSLTLALFRIVEAARGRIVIDGIDISKLGLHDLRSRLTIIPQEPVLFSGSLRFNIDPEEIYTDAAVWQALEHSHLKEWVESSTYSNEAGGLSMVVAEDGQNLSVGQRQLVCLARALLRKSRILVLDEATAAVDAETDELIQRTIRREFADATVITIAHRLNTILDCDRVMIVDAGKVKEFDRPSVLLRNTKSELNRLARAANIAAAAAVPNDDGESTIK